jgi:hypothetical protein
MTPSAQQGDQLGPLNPGDVVSAALRLYKDKFKPYFQLAVLATSVAGRGRGWHGRGDRDF